MSAGHSSERVRAQHMLCCLSIAISIGVSASRRQDPSSSAGSHRNRVLDHDLLGVHDSSMEVELSSIECRMVADPNHCGCCIASDSCVGRLGDGSVRQVRRSEQRLHLDRMLAVALVLVLARRMAVLLGSNVGSDMVQLGGDRHLAIDQLSSNQCSSMAPDRDVPHCRICSAVHLGGSGRVERRHQAHWRVHDLLSRCKQGSQSESEKHFESATKSSTRRLLMIGDCIVLWIVELGSGMAGSPRQCSPFQ
mgnify:CR=1 FL=1